jgi:hypothetical protein
MRTIPALIRSAGVAAFVLSLTACGDTNESEAGADVVVSQDTTPPSPQAGEHTIELDSAGGESMSVAFLKDPPGTLRCTKAGKNRGKTKSVGSGANSLSVNAPLTTRYAAAAWGPKGGAIAEDYVLAETGARYPEVTATDLHDRHPSITLTATDCTWTGNLVVYEWNGGDWTALPTRRGFDASETPPSGVSADSTAYAVAGTASARGAERASDAAPPFAPTTRFALGTD